MTAPKPTPQQVAEEHYEYIKGLLVASGQKVTELDRYLYIQAMVHGTKHGREEKSK